MLSPTLLIVLFACAAVLSLVSAAAGGFFALWIVHVQRTGESPIPQISKITLFRRREPPRDPDDDEDEDDDEPRGRVGP